MLQKDDDTQPITHEEIEEEVLNFYNKLMGTTDIELDGIYIIVMREGPQLSNEQRENVISPIVRIMRLI